MTREAAFAELYRTHYRRVFELCRQLLGSPDRAEDAAQEAFMRAHRNFGNYDPGRPFSAWITGIASNRCIDMLRRNKRTAALFGTEAGELVELQSDGSNVLTDVLKDERADRVRAAVAELPERYRIPLVLAYFRDASYDEIAASLGITRSHVGALICRGKQKLRLSLGAGTEDQQ